LISGCVTSGYGNRWDDYYREAVDNLKEADRLQREQQQLISVESPDVEEIVQLANAASLTATNAQNWCDSWACTGRVNSTCIDCLGNFRSIAATAAQMTVNAANYCAKKGHKDRAKQLYLEVITTYVGDAYRSYVRQAEFGLEDLKEK
jgi:hypothetical protein